MKSIIYIFIILSSLGAIAQQKVNWVEFEDLPSFQAQNSKPMFIYIYADWCVYCKKMERVSFENKDNVTLLNENYFALKFNLETEENIVFDGEIYKNQELKTNRQPKHDLAKFLTGQQDKIGLPAIVILDQNLNIIKQLHTYLSPEKLHLLLIQ